MAVFIDTGMWVAARNARDEFHSIAQKIIQKALRGTFGRMYTSDYVFGETIILAIVRTKQHAIARDIGDYILECPNITFLFTPESIFRDAWRVHDQYRDKPLSFTDCTIISWCHLLNIDHMASFDVHFDGILQRVAR